MIKRTLLTAAPIAAAVMVFGVSFGVLATVTGLPPWATVLMSALVFAGSAQFAAIAVLAGGGGVVAAVITGALLNLRYLATGIAVAPALPGRRPKRALLSQLVVDESYALGVGAGSGGRPHGPTVMVAGAAFWSAWVLGTAIGAALGPVAGDPKRFGLDAAFPALFMALLWPMLKGPRAVRCALAGGLVALLLAPFTPSGVPLAGAALVGLWLAR